MAGAFEVYKDKVGEFRFRLKAANGEIVLASEGYKTKSSCKNGIMSVQTNAPNEARYERKLTKAGKPFFTLKAGNYQVIGTSQSYTDKAGCEKGIASIKKNAATAAIVDV